MKKIGVSHALLESDKQPSKKRDPRALTRGNTTIDDLQSITGLSRIDLEWHLSIFEYGFCVKKEIQKNKPIYKLTQEGRVIDRME